MYDVAVVDVRISPTVLPPFLKIVIEAAPLDALACVKTPVFEARVNPSAPDEVAPTRRLFAIVRATSEPAPKIFTPPSSINNPFV